MADKYGLRFLEETMKPFVMSEIKELISIANMATSSNHPFLDQRWNCEGVNIDGKGYRNKYYRRQYYRFYQLLAKTYKPQIVVELGIDEGDSVAHFASGCPETKVYGVDVHKDWEWPSKRCREIEKIFPNFTYLRGWTWDRAKDIEALNRPIDILVIDSWHEPNYFIRDWNDYSKYLRPGSLVIVDDIYTPGIGNAFELIPGESIMDGSMTTNTGICIFSGEKLELPYTKQMYMP